MTKLKLKPGDIFLTHNSSNPFSWAIKKIEERQAEDGKANYSHAGIFLDSTGTTFEALWWIGKFDFYEKYYNTHNYLIARHDDMNSERFKKGWELVKKHRYRPYPAHRLFLFLIPTLADKLNILDWAVCSELTSKFLYGAGILDFWSGVMPSDLGDIIHDWSKFKILYKN